MPSELLLDLMRKKGFAELTEIQRLAIPAVETGENCLVIAPTGYGKTECALLPVFDFLVKKKNESEASDAAINSLNSAGKAKAKAIKSKNGIQALYITPLRALNRDMMERISWWSEQLGITVSVRHGDTTQSDRQKQVRNPPQLLITTPETLQAILPTIYLGEALKSVEKVVIDEVHELFPEKRGAQLSVALERLLEKREAKPFQRIGLSATVGSPEAAAAFLCGDRPCKIIRLPIERAIHLSIESPQPTEKDYKLGGKLSMDGAAAARLEFVEKLVNSHKSTLVFTNTRSVAETLGSRLRALNETKKTIQVVGEGKKPNRVGVHHGSLSKESRINAEEQFKSNELNALICTSSLELGIDIGSVDLVIQYSSPRQAQRLVQRVGRSGHSIGKIPKGIIVANDEDDILEAAVVARRASKNLLEHEGETTLAFDVLAHQVAGLMLDSIKEERPLSEIFNIVKRAHPYSTLTEKELLSVAQQLHYESLLILDANPAIPILQQVVRRNARTRGYYYDNLSMIPDSKRFFIKNAATNTNVATLDESFVASYVDIGATIIIRGTPWRVLDVAEEEIVVEPSQDISAAVPDWHGEEIPVPFAVAQEVGLLRREIADAKGKPILGYPISSEALQKAYSLVSKQQSIAPADDKHLLIEELSEVIIVHSLLGNKGNESLSRLLSSLINTHTGGVAKCESDAYRIMIRSKITVSEVAELLKQTNPSFAEKTILDSIASSTLFRYKFIHVAKSFGLIAKDADYSMVRIERIIEQMKDSPVFVETLRQFERDYLDVDSVRWLLSAIKNKSLAVRCVRLVKPSPFSQLVISKLQSAGELLLPIEPASEILKSFKHNILEKQVKLFCTYCNSVEFHKISDIKRDEKLKCAHCKSPLLAPVDPKIRSFPDLQKKLKEGKTNFNANEIRARNYLIHASGLVQAHGRDAIAALEVYGVGIQTAARVLQKMQKNEDLLFRDLLEAQKTFIRTKRYWQA